jgi:2,3,4,5-tetrahydropyridine-2-carboxylate N-succinyltransferase
MQKLQEIIEKTWDNRELLNQGENQQAIRDVIELIDKGQLRVAEPNGDDWKVNEWVKKAVVSVFSHSKNGDY